jgi:hypothetical protein
MRNQSRSVSKETKPTNTHADGVTVAPNSIGPDVTACSSLHQQNHESCSAATAVFIDTNTQISISISMVELRLDDLKNNKSWPIIAL